MNTLETVFSFVTESRALGTWKRYFLEKTKKSIVWDGNAAITK